MNWPLISVIIPTYQREAVLCASVDEALRQDYPNFEVLVVDQTQQHEPDTEQHLQHLADVGKVQWYRVDWASLPAARNYGVSKAKGDIILFIDDDVELPPVICKPMPRNFKPIPRRAPWPDGCLTA
jgi:glycosyltransferase involved in cell wall biosynthesis